MTDVIKCGSCQRANDPWRRHCGGCGSGLPGGCPGCGAINRADDKFCGGCARALRVTPVPAAHTSTMPIDISELLPDDPKRR